MNSKEILEATKIIAKYDGVYKWFSPIDKTIYTEETWLGFLIEQEYPFKYDEKWDWQIPVWQKLYAEATKKLVKDDSLLEIFMLYCEKLRKVILVYSPAEGFELLVKALKWYQDVKEKIK